MAKIIDAYRVDTGAKVRIPDHWLGHPKLGKPFRKTPTQKSREAEQTASATKSPAATTNKKEG